MLFSFISEDFMYQSRFSLKLWFPFLKGAVMFTIEVLQNISSSMAGTLNTVFDAYKFKAQHKISHHTLGTKMRKYYLCTHIITSSEHLIKSCAGVLM